MLGDFFCHDNSRGLDLHNSPSDTVRVLHAQSSPGGEKCVCVLCVLCVCVCVLSCVYVCVVCDHNAIHQFALNAIDCTQAYVFEYFEIVFKQISRTAFVHNSYDSTIFQGFAEHLDVVFSHSHTFHTLCVHI